MRSGLFKIPWTEQRGITGLETAIVLIAFVVVSSVFAFAALSTGLFSSDKAKETIQAGLAETRGSMELKSPVVIIPDGSSTTSSAISIAFQVANAAGGNAIDLTPGKLWSNTQTSYSPRCSSLIRRRLGSLPPAWAVRTRTCS